MLKVKTDITSKTSARVFFDSVPASGYFEALLEI